MKKKTKNEPVTALENFVKKNLLSLPVYVKSIFVLVAPWYALFSIVSTVVFLSVLPSIINNLLHYSNYSFYYSYLFSVSITLIGRTLPDILNLLAFKGLLKHSLSSWNLLFFAFLLNFIPDILPVIKPVSVLLSILPLYILYQIKEYYN